MKCADCEHSKEYHGEVCSGAIDCLCTKFIEPVLRPMPPTTVQETLDEPVKEQFGRGVWRGNGWNYKKSFGATQKKMIEHYLLMGKSVDEIQKLLHCKRSSIRGRKSELKSAGLISS